MNIIRKCGYTSEEIDEAMRECDRVRRQRDKSISFIAFDFLASAKATFGRTMKKMRRSSIEQMGRKVKNVVRAASFSSGDHKSVAVAISA